MAISLGVGALLTWGPYALTFQAQEILGGVLSLLAVAMVTWMIFWMGTHGASLSHELRGQVDTALDRSWIAIVVLGAVSVGREGVETALFVWANVRRRQRPVLGTIGAVLGILTAVVISWGISKGLVRINLAVFFTWTGVFLILVAAGVLAYGIGDLQEAVGASPAAARPPTASPPSSRPAAGCTRCSAASSTSRPSPPGRRSSAGSPTWSSRSSLYLRLLRRRASARRRVASAAPASSAHRPRYGATRHSTAAHSIPATFDPSELELR